MVPGRWIPPHSRMEPLGTLWGGGDSGLGTPFPQGKRYFQSCLKIIAGYIVTIKQPRVVFLFSEFFVVGSFVGRSLRGAPPLPV